MKESIAVPMMTNISKSTISSKSIKSIIPINKPKVGFPVKKKIGFHEDLNVDFRPDWIHRVDFEICDAAKFLQKYAYQGEEDFTHIYSYNKVMSLKDRRSISEILNRTNFRLLAWYFNPDKSRLSGLKHF